MPSYVSTAAYIKYPAAGSTYKYSNGAALLPFKMLDGVGACRSLSLCLALPSLSQEQTGSEYTVNVYLGGQRVRAGLAKNIDCDENIQLKYCCYIFSHRKIISGLHFDGYVAAKNVTIKSTQFPAGTYSQFHQE